MSARQTAIRAAVAQSERASTDRQRFDRLVGTGAVPAHDGRSACRGDRAEQDVARGGHAERRREEGPSPRHGVRRSSRVNAKPTRSSRGRMLRSISPGSKSRAHRRADRRCRRQSSGTTRRLCSTGTRLMTLVPLSAVYVTANFKETQTPRMRPGQHVDHGRCIAGYRTTGTVDSFAPGSGSQFSCCRSNPEPATSRRSFNVCRCASISSSTNPVAQLRPGLSVTARVRLVD